MNSFSNLNLAIPDLWEVRDVINKVKNVVLNYTEMEAKVHEATNNEAWGASSTVMQEIAQATFNYQYFNEIMPTIYKRFTEKEARQWRQIYKSLVLLEYLVKNGSERVVDDARSHISMIKMMKNFHYVDEKGKDQGINVRNRAKELAELLNDVDTIKAERKKAKKNRNKYTGVGSDGSMSFGGSGGGGGGYSSSRFEGFGSDSNYSSGAISDNYSGYGNGGGYGNSGGYDNSSDFFDDERPGRYDEDSSPSSQQHNSSKNSSSPASAKQSSTKAKTAKELNLFDFEDEPSSNKGKSSTTANDDDWGDFAAGDGNDDFDDFQSAPTVQQHQPSSSTTAPPKKANDIFDLLGEDNAFTSSPVAPQQSQQPQAQSLMLSQGISFDILTANSNTSSSSIPHQQSPAIQPLSNPSSAQPAETENKPTIGGIWSGASNLISLDSLGTKATPTKPAQGPSMNSLKNSSANAGWNNWASANPSPNNQQQQQQQQKKQTSAFDDLLF